MMQYIDQSGGQGAGLLKQKVKQENLPKDVAKAIIKELSSPSKARLTLELLETCISFLQVCVCGSAGGGGGVYVCMYIYVHVLAL